MSTTKQQVPPWTTFKEKTLYELALKHISKFELYDTNQLILVRSTSTGQSIAYITEPGERQKETTRLDLTICDTYGDLIWMCIAPEYRRQGYGERLYRRVEDICTETGCSSIVLTPSGAGYSFWPKMGFKRHGKNLVPTYRKELKK